MESWEFGQAIRRWRDRLAPETVGVSAGGRRRAAGLRREELAGLAGISADYLTRLEQAWRRRRVLSCGTCGTSSRSPTQARSPAPPSGCSSPSRP